MSIKKSDNCLFITPETKMIEPCFHGIFQSVVHHNGRISYSENSPLSLINAACLAHGSDYNGRRKSTQHLLNYHKCTPIVIIPTMQVVTFPTCSPDSKDCVWLFLKQIKDIEPLTKKQTTVSFHDGTSVVINATYTFLRNQRARAADCISTFNNIF